MTDAYVMLKPREEWPDPGQAEIEVIEEIEPPPTTIPGNAYEFTQPIQMRFNELIAGVRSDVGVKVYGDDLDDAAGDRRAGRRRRSAASAAPPT